MEQFWNGSEIVTKTDYEAFAPDELRVGCPWCYWAGSIDDCDVLGACEGVLYCPECTEPFNSEDLTKHDGCEECEGCYSLDAQSVLPFGE